jgi:hypothetical protein
MTTNEFLAFVNEELSKGTRVEEIHKKLKKVLTTDLHTQLRTVVKEQLSKGSTEEEILRALMKGGEWSELGVKDFVDAMRYTKVLEHDKAPATMSPIDRLEERARRFKAFAEKFAAAATKAISEVVERAIALLQRCADRLVQIADAIRRTLIRVRQVVWSVIKGLWMVSKYYSPGVGCLILAWALTREGKQKEEQHNGMPIHNVSPSAIIRRGCIGPVTKVMSQSPPWRTGEAWRPP